MNHKHNRDTIAITDLGAYKRNLVKIREYTGSRVRLMAVVKANAYGHGMIECARTALDAGASMLGVALASEGVALREAGITAPILVFSAESYDYFEMLICNNLTITLISGEMLIKLGKELKRLNASCTVHINVDTGMGRVGVKYKEAFKLTRDASDNKNITIEGIYSHFPSADEDRDEYSLNQIVLFKNLIGELEQNGLRPPFVHMCNSAATLKFPQAHFDIVRPGIMTYGLIPYIGSQEKLILEPVLSFVSKIGFIKKVPAGYPVSYGGTFVTERPSVLATVPVGYGDGFNRHLSNNGRAIINGKSVPVAGRVCMDQTVFDVTDAGKVSVGDQVILIGKDGNEQIVTEEHAEIAETITHEIVTGITGRVSRIYKETT